jgi:hypothetical protein
LKPLEVISNKAKPILTLIAEESKSEYKLVKKRHISPNQTKSEGNSKILKLSDFKPA